MPAHRNDVVLAVEDVEGLVDRVGHVPGDAITSWGVAEWLNASSVSAADASSEPPAPGTGGRRLRSRRKLVIA